MLEAVRREELRRAALRSGLVGIEPDDLVAIDVVHARDYGIWRSAHREFGGDPATARAIAGEMWERAAESVGNPSVSARAELEVALGRMDPDLRAEMLGDVDSSTELATTLAEIDGAYPHGPAIELRQRLQREAGLPVDSTALVPLADMEPVKDFGLDL